jgi:hypothetical protein
VSQESVEIVRRALTALSCGVAARGRPRRSAVVRLAVALASARPETR